MGRLADASLVHGMTVSCQTNGREWGTDAFADELERLAALGVNWVAIHPYARITERGEVLWRSYDPPPRHVVRPIEEAHARGLSILVVPHLAHWGSRFGSRGEIEFEGEARKIFLASYREWILELAEVAREADAFCVGSELDRWTGEEAAWRDLVAGVRERTQARLTYAANWNVYAEVPFWDALDAIGVQAYFPLAQESDPSEGSLRAGWKRVLDELRELSARTGKPVVFTELGYNRSTDAARAPWDHRSDRGEAAEALQLRCLRVALGELEAEREWLRGAFLWKWFAGPAPRANFVLDTPALREVIARAWLR